MTDRRRAQLQRLMTRAVRLARSGLGATYPNPCVGAVVARGDTVLGAARSGPTGSAHAETRALARAGSAARGATMVVTLEPCCHQGRTGPCTRAIIEAGIRTVVVGVRDPAPHVDGKGIRRLRRAGLEVVLGVGEAACTEVHEHYLHHVRTGRPFVTFKAATSLDGCIATAAGDSRWITGERSRKDGHRQRAIHHAIAIGAETALLDDPQLSVRHVRGVDPVPVVFDPRLRTGGPRAPRLRILRPGTLVLHTAAASAAARGRVGRTGATLVAVSDDGTGRIHIPTALEVLGALEVRSLLVEGGGRLIGALVAASAWQRGLLYQAPRILGAGRRVVAGVQWPTVAEAPSLRVVTRRRLGPDMLTVIEPTPSSPGPARRRARS